MTFFPTSIFILIIFNIISDWFFQTSILVLSFFFFKTMFVWMILSDKYRMILNLFYLSAIFLVFYYIFYFNAYFNQSTLPWFFLSQHFLEYFFRHSIFFWTISLNRKRGVVIILKLSFRISIIIHIVFIWAILILDISKTFSQAPGEYPKIHWPKDNTTKIVMLIVKTYCIIKHSLEHVQHIFTNDYIYDYILCLYLKYKYVCVHMFIYTCYLKSYVFWTSHCL